MAFHNRTEKLMEIIESMHICSCPNFYHHLSPKPRYNPPLISLPHMEPARNVYKFYLKLTSSHLLLALQPRYFTWTTLSFYSDTEWGPQTGSIVRLVE